MHIRGGRNTPVTCQVCKLLAWVKTRGKKALKTSHENNFYISYIETCLTRSGPAAQTILEWLEVCGTFNTTRCTPAPTPPPSWPGATTTRCGILKLTASITNRVTPLITLWTTLKRPATGGARRDFKSPGSRFTWPARSPSPAWRSLAMALRTRRGSGRSSWGLDWSLPQWRRVKGEMICWLTIPSYSSTPTTTVRERSSTSTSPNHWRPSTSCCRAMTSPPPGFQLTASCWSWRRWEWSKVSGVWRRWRLMTLCVALFSGCPARGKKWETPQEAASHTGVTRSDKKSSMEVFSFFKKI